MPQFSFNAELKNEKINKNSIITMRPFFCCRVEKRVQKKRVSCGVKEAKENEVCTLIFYGPLKLTQMFILIRKCIALPNMNKTQRRFANNTAIR